MKRTFSLLLVMSLLCSSLASAQQKREPPTDVKLNDAADQVLAELRKLERAGTPLTYDFVFTISIWLRRQWTTAPPAVGDRDASIRWAEEYVTHATRVADPAFLRLVPDERLHATITRYFMLDAKRLLAQLRGKPMPDAPALVLAAEAAYQRLDEYRARGNPLTLSLTHALCFFSEKWLRTELIVAISKPEQAHDAHLARMRTLAEIVAKDDHVARVQRTLVRYFLEDALARVAQMREGDARVHLKSMIDAITEHRDALSARERAGDPLTPEFLEFIHAASLRRMTASWLAQPGREERAAAAELHLKAMKDLRTQLHSILDGAGHANAAAEFYVINAERIVEDVRAFGSAYVDPMVE